jgi:hypothetical protein
MAESSPRELRRAVDRAALELRMIDDGVAAAKPNPDVWSIKEILGHLIDSASNNHQRFVRVQLSGELSFPGYEQNAWVELQGYQERPWTQLVDLWALYNHHLADVIARIPNEAFDVPCRIGSDEPIFLRTLVEDYITHLRHHLKQIQQRHAV